MVDILHRGRKTLDAQGCFRRVRRAAAHLRPPLFLVFVELSSKGLLPVGVCENVQVLDRVGGHRERVLGTQSSQPKIGHGFVCLFAC